LAAVLLVLPAVPAGAAVLESATGAVVYTWSDAAAAADGDPLVAAALETARSEGECDALQPALAERIEGLLQGTRALGVPAGVFRGLEVYVLPVHTLPIPSGQDDRVVPAVSYEGAVVLAGLYRAVPLEWVFLHELGHHVARAALGVNFGGDWTGAAPEGREYLALRGYPLECGLDGKSQASLLWGDRASEWFAEDFAYWAASRLGRAEWLKVYTAACGPPDERILGWLDVLFMRMKTKDAWEEVKAK